MTAAYNLLAYRRHDDNSDEHRYAIPDWNLERAVRWAADRGHDTILVELHDQPVRDGASPLSTHHVCADPSCPGGCYFP